MKGNERKGKRGKEKKKKIERECSREGRRSNRHNFNSTMRIPILAEISSLILHRTYEKYSGPLNRPKSSRNEENP